MPENQHIRMSFSFSPNMQDKNILDSGGMESSWHDTANLEIKQTHKTRSQTCLDLESFKKNILERLISKAVRPFNLEKAEGKKYFGYYAVMIITLSIIFSLQIVFLWVQIRFLFFVEHRVVKVRLQILLRAGEKILTKVSPSAWPILEPLPLSPSCSVSSLLCLSLLFILG